MKLERELGAADDGPPRVPLLLDGKTILVSPDVPAKIEKAYGRTKLGTLKTR